MNKYKRYSYKRYQLMGEELVEETETTPVTPKKKSTKVKNASKSPKKPSTKKYVG
jgi:hypothetical protein